jgi:hypothetical protein
MTDVETAILYKVERDLFQSCRTITDEKGEENECNIDDSVMHLCFSTILLHVRMLTENKNNVVAQRLFQACAVAEADMKILYKAGDQLRTDANFPTEKAVNDSTRMNLETRLDAMNNKVDRALHEITYLKRQNAQLIQLIMNLTPTSGCSGLIHQSPPLENAVKLSTIINFSGPIDRFFYSWFYVEPWKYERVGKSEQSLMSEFCAAIAILKIVHNEPLLIMEKPSQDNVDEFSKWKNNLQITSKLVMDNFNSNMATIDRKKPTLKASGIRSRYKSCHQMSPQYARILRRFAKLWMEEKVVDLITPKEYQKEGQFHVKALPAISLVPIDEDEEI